MFLKGRYFSGAHSNSSSARPPRSTLLRTPARYIATRLFRIVNARGACGELRILRQISELGPGERVDLTRRHHRPCLTRIFSADECGAHAAFGDQFRMLDQCFSRDSPHRAPAAFPRATSRLPRVASESLTRFDSFDHKGFSFDGEHQVDDVAQGNVRCVRTMLLPQQRPTLNVS